MSIKEVTMFTACCDRCGVSADEDTEYMGWNDAEAAMLVADEYGWFKYAGKLYCWECMDYDETTDEYKPKGSLDGVG